MTSGNVILIAAGALTALGVGQRVLDRLRLTDRQAILIVAAMLIGGLMPDIPISGRVSVNLGGAVIPLILCAYLLFKADTAWEVWRTILASALTALAVYWIGRLLPADPEELPIEPMYLFALSAGLAAWLFGRSRRGAFVAGVLGMTIADIASALALYARGIDQRLVLGGAGIADGIVAAGFLGLMLAELTGEVTERITRGKKKSRRSFQGGEITKRRERA